MNDHVPYFIWRGLLRQPLRLPPFPRLLCFRGCLCDRAAGLTLGVVCLPLSIMLRRRGRGPRPNPHASLCVACFSPVDTGFIRNDARRCRQYLLATWAAFSVVLPRRWEGFVLAAFAASYACYFVRHYCAPHHPAISPCFVGHASPRPSQFVVSKLRVQNKLWVAFSERWFDDSQERTLSSEGAKIRHHMRERLLDNVSETRRMMDFVRCPQTFGNKPRGFGPKSFGRKDRQPQYRSSPVALGESAHGSPSVQTISSQDFSKAFVTKLLCPIWCPDLDFPFPDHRLLRPPRRYSRAAGLRFRLEDGFFSERYLDSPIEDVAGANRRGRKSAAHLLHG